jgi:prepilin-type N-terminal cleavage/methylation domain-containing protein
MKQKGFTLIELLVVVAVGGILIWGTVTAIYQVMVGTSRTNSQVVALIDVHHAALRLKKDLQMAQTYTTFIGGARFLKLEWTDYTSFVVEENLDHYSQYEMWGSELRRIYDGTSSIVGRYIDSVDISQSGDRVINVVITSTKGDVTPHSETLEFSVYMRGVGGPEE